MPFEAQDPIGQALGALVATQDRARAAAIPPAPVTPARLPTVGRGSYSHKAMVDLMVDCPDYTHEQLCAHFNRPASWLASVLASDQFQLALDERRHEVLDPTLTASLQERFKALAIRTSNVMMTKMDSKEVTDFLVLKAGEISIKALGMGQKGAEVPQAASAAIPEKTVAERILEAMDRREASRTVDVTSVEVP